jgi:drug/metabolite transporter (DMT)-like permease
MSGAAVSAYREQNNLAGIGLMLGAIFVFSLNDALGKWLAASYDAPQILLFRSIAGLLLLLPVVRRMGWRAFVEVERPWLQALRVAMGVGETAMFYWAVRYLPLADTMTYYLAGPIYVTILAAVFLGEKVGWRRWLAVLIGFVGVLIALGPSTESMGWPALIAFAGSVIYSGFLIITRLLRRTHDTVMASWQMAAGLIFGMVGTPFTWVTPSSWVDILLIALLGVGGLIATIGVNRSLAVAPASVVVPYQYTMIVWAATFGYVFFGNVLSPQTTIGAAVIVCAGLFIFFREQRRGMPVAAEAPPER